MATLAWLDDEVCYRALSARDRRFDGWFFVGVTSTGIYCRPSCPSVMPKRAHARFFPTAAGAQREGFRACKRCRPDGVPGSPEWNRRSDVVGRAMRLIGDGVVDREGVSGLAGRLGFSHRHLHRLLVAEVGAGPLDLARAQRCESARILLETTNLRLGEVAFAAGFGSIRQFNDTIRQVYGEAPSALRARTVERPDHHGSRRPRDSFSSVTLRLAYRPPFPTRYLFRFLAARAVPGVEEGTDSWYRRSLALPHGDGIVTVRKDVSEERSLTCRLQLQDLRDLSTAVKRIRRLLDLDADPEAVTQLLGSDSLIGSAVRRSPGLRIPGHIDGDELAVRAVLGQQVSVIGARTLAARLAEAHGRELSSELEGLRWLFPPAAVIAGLSPDAMAMPAARARALICLCEQLAGGAIRLDPGADPDETSSALLELPGIGPWTVAYVRMRALGDPDAFLPTDLGVVRALKRLGAPSSKRAVLALGERWRPYRSYALQYLWSGLAGAGVGQVTDPMEKESARR